MSRTALYAMRICNFSQVRKIVQQSRGMSMDPMFQMVVDLNDLIIIVLKTAPYVYCTNTHIPHLIPELLVPTWFLLRF